MTDIERQLLLTKAKPCHLCNGGAEFYHSFITDDYGIEITGWKTAVSCRFCGRVKTEYYETEAEAVNEWNKIN